MKNFRQSKLYMITCLTTNLKYIGATTKADIYTRLQQHIYYYNRHEEGHANLYCSSFEIIKNDNFKIELLEEYPCNNQEELDTKERYYIQSINCVNKYIPSRTRKEYYVDKIDEFKDYYQKVKDNDRFKKKIECECGCHYTLNNKRHHINTFKHQIKLLSN